MKETVYTGMNPKYYMGYQSEFCCKPEDLLPWDGGCFQGSDSSTSGSSSITANVVSQDEAEGGMQMPVAAQQDILPPLDRPLPIRKRQRKPCKKGKTVQAEAPCSPAPTQKRKRGRKPKASNKTGSRLTGVAEPRKTKASKEGQVAGVQRGLGARTPTNPPKLPELRPRHAPRKMWPADEEEEEDNMGFNMGVYNPSPSVVKNARAPRKPKQAVEGKLRHPKGKKHSGPCAKCDAVWSVTWRRGAHGRSYARQPLCNRCGVWESRHSDSDEEGPVKVHGRRRVTVARRPNNLFRAGPEQPLLHANLRALPSLPRREARTTSEDANLLDGTCRATAVETAVTAAAALPTNSKMQLWQGCNNLVARVPVTSSMQLWAKPEGAGMADKADESMISRGIGVQLGCTKFSGKRSAEASIAQPSSKRWRIEAYTGPAVSSIGQQTSSCGTANAAGLIGVGSCSGAAWQKVAEGAMASFNHVGLSLRPSAAMSQQCDSVEES